MRFGFLRLNFRARVEVNMAKGYFIFSVFMTGGLECGPSGGQATR